MDEAISTATPAAKRSGVARIWAVPAGQPRWVRPVLSMVTAAAGMAYAWRIDSASLEPFYGAAARSMASSWHDFIFGAFDPVGSVTVDKLPGAVWLEALSLRVFGFHVWAVVLPQVLEGMLTILVLYRAVARLAGPVAGILAAVLLAASPVTVALNRGNIADSLLILLTVLAADAMSSALCDRRIRPLLLAGVWVGLAFQAKMMAAWLVLPGLLTAYLLAAEGPIGRRLTRASLAVLVTVVVSLSWISTVSLVPAHERPYVDGTQNDSLFSQVFEYNGVSRLGNGKGLESLTHPAAFLLKLSDTGRTLNANSAKIPASWHRLLEGLFARDIGWLYPAALISMLGVLALTRGADRRSSERSCIVMWGLWLMVLFLFFSQGAYLNSYYVAALAPAIAALCGTGVAVAARHWSDLRVRVAVALAALASIVYGIYLLHGATGVPVWLVPVAAALAIASAVVPMKASLRLGRWSGQTLPATVVCALVLPLVASVLVAARDLGPFDAPYEPVRQRASPQRKYQLQRATLEAIEGTYPAPIELATYTSTLAGPYILASGKEVLPIGGFLGGIPHPTLGELQRDVASGRLRTFLIPLKPPSADPRIVWIAKSCKQATPPSGTTDLTFFECSPVH